MLESMPRIGWAVGLVLMAIPVGAAAEEVSLASYGDGATLVQKADEYGGGWTGEWLLDERPQSGWASPEKRLGPHVFVIALPEKSAVSRLEFDTQSIDGDGRGAKNVRLEISDTSASTGFVPLASVTLQDRADRQSFPVAATAAGRFLRLTVLDNHGAADYTELMDVRAYGRQLTNSPMADVSGTYETNFNDFHVLQQSTSLVGCYEYKEGVLVGGLEGHVMKLTWREGPDHGPALMVFSPDGKEFTGFWGRGEDGVFSGGRWDGKKKSSVVGTCPHWKGDAQTQLQHDLATEGHVRFYGINFDSDSGVIRDESKPALDRLAAVLKAHLDWKLTVEGHTDSLAGAAHNQTLSQARADAVKAYLTRAGIEAGRLRTVGLGATKPVASNDSAAGRAENRRVELVRN
ncbi:MAG: OmpA family protein [Acidobacteriota bacterium]